MKLLGKYVNGNYKVIIFEDGTKVRYNDLDCMIPDTVESLDLKITNCCDRNCLMCHENSKIDGKHADLFTPSFIDNLHPYTELAIGGGNPLEHPDLETFLIKCKEKKLIPSMTVNQFHFENNFDLIKSLVDRKLVYGLGVSLTKVTDDLISKLKSIPNSVVHTIAGLTTIADYKALKDNNLKILILGYKRFRRGKDLYEKQNKTIDKNIAQLQNNLLDMIQNSWFDVLSFDNLALEQLRVKDFVSKKDWEEFYMGDDGIGDNFDSATMYVDLVERKFAKNSCDPNRYNLLPTIEEMYNFLKTTL